MKSNEAPKSALPASIPPPARRQSPDEDETIAPPAPPKATFLPTGLSRAIVISSTLLMITAGAVGLLGNRYTLVPIPSSPNATAYRLDRLTGRVAFCSPLQCAPMPPLPSKPPKADKVDKGN